MFFFSDERDGLPDVGLKNQQGERGQPEGNSPQSGSGILVAQSLGEDSLPGASVCTEPAETNLSLGVSFSSSTEELQGSAVKRGDATTVSTAEGQDASSQDNILAGINSNVEARRAETLLCLQIRVRDLEMQLVDRTEWAQQKVMQAARRLSKDRNEMNSLRAERDELMRAKKDQKTLEDSTMKKLADMEAALRRASGQVDRANQAVSRLEKENAEVRAEMEAAKLNAAESMELCQEVAKKEKKDVKKAQCWEKQKAKLQESLAEERAKVAELKQQLVQAKELQQQAEVIFTSLYLTPLTVLLMFCNGASETFALVANSTLPECGQLSKQELSVVKVGTHFIVHKGGIIRGLFLVSSLKNFWSISSDAFTI